MSANSHGVDFATLPESSRNALLSRGLTHYLGSEVAAKVTAWVNREENAGATVEQKAAKKAEFYEAAKEALLAGTVGMNARGPRLDPVEAEMARLAKQEVKAILAGAGMKLVKGEAKFADGTVKSLDAMVETRLEREGERLRKAAEKSIADAAKKAKATADAAKSAGTVTADTLGL